MTTGNVGTVKLVRIIRGMQVVCTIQSRRVTNERVDSPFTEALPKANK